MKTFPELRKICKQNSRISERVVDDFLINYTAGHQGMEKKMDQRFAHYRHVTKALGNQALNLLKAQYLAHRLFRQGGLLGKFLQHPALRFIRGEDREYLLQQQKLPWRFSFHKIEDNPADDFFHILDVLTGEKYLLYSPRMSEILETDKPTLWFNLIGFNGYCWQTFGPVVSYRSFGKEDILFFAGELNPDLEDEAGVAAHVEKDPVPYMMLLSGAAYPMTFSRGEQVLYLLAEHDLDSLDTAALRKDFTSEYDRDVYRFTHKEWGEPPHFGQAWFDEKEGLLLFTAMTEKGFREVVKAFNAHGSDFPDTPYLRVNMTMVTTAENILKRKVVLNEYQDYFPEETDPDKERLLEDINAFIALIMEDVNAGKKPDVEAAIRKTGVNPETARSVMESVMGSLEKIPPSGKKSTGTKLPAGTLLSKDDEMLLNLHLYMTIDRIRRLSPWEFMFEDEVFGVQVPGKDLVYFISVMGAEGEYMALSLYRGNRGLAEFVSFREDVDRNRRLYESEEEALLASLRMGGTMAIPHLILSCMDREDLGKGDLDGVRKSGAGIRGRGNWPSISEVRPGQVPVYPGRDTLAELYLVLQQVLGVIERVEEERLDLEREDDFSNPILVRVPSGKGPRFRWKDHWLKVDPQWGHITYRPELEAGSIEKVTALAKRDQVLQLDLFMLHSPVMEKGTNGYFPYILLYMDRDSGIVLKPVILNPLPDLDSMFESLPQVLLDELRELGYRPSAIELRSDLLYDLLEEFLTQAGIKVVWQRNMPAMDDIITSMQRDLG